MSEQNISEEAKSLANRLLSKAQNAAILNGGVFYSPELALEAAAIIQPFLSTRDQEIARLKEENSDLRTQLYNQPPNMSEARPWVIVNIDGELGNVEDSHGNAIFIYVDLRDCERAVAAHNAALSTHDSEIARLKQILAKQGYDISQTLGKALGYITDDSNSNVGEHIAETLADEAGRELVRLKEGLKLTQENHIKSIEERDRLNARISELEKERTGAEEALPDVFKSDPDYTLANAIQVLINERVDQNARITDLERDNLLIGQERLELIDQLETARNTTCAVERERDELQSQNASFRNSSKACEDCDAVTMEEVKKLRADLEAKEMLLAIFNDERLSGVASLQTKLTDSEARCSELLEVVKFYAAPETYFAVGFMADKPCGDFMDDFDETVFGVKPGKLARNTLKPSTEK